MKRPQLSLPPKTVAKNVVQQAADFTAEGAPPPGKVGTDVPVEPDQQTHHGATHEAEASRQAKASHAVKARKAAHS